jgi:two-component system, cell cycle response regulator
MVSEEKHKNRILIADDDAISRHMLQFFLVKWGYEVTAAADGLEALRILESREAPSLAVLDWMMPGVEGPAVCKRVRENPELPYMYILLLTARNQKADILRGLESGADDYLTKPFNAQELRARLHVGQRILNLQENLIMAKEELFFRATHDSLTGIANRGVAMDALLREQSRQVREEGSFGVILADIDHFKYINDKYGHLCGDAVLKEAAGRMFDCARPYDTMGRYGGEEFLIVVPASGALGPLELAERMRKALESRPFTTTAGEVQVTASFGVAISSKENPLDSQGLLHLADDALYRAKKYGRNRTELADAIPAPDPSPISA